MRGNHRNKDVQNSLCRMGVMVGASCLLRESDWAGWKGEGLWMALGFHWTSHGQPLWVLKQDSSDDGMLWFRKLGTEIRQEAFYAGSVKMILHMCMCAKSLQSSLIMCDPVDCSQPGSSVHGILQAAVLEWGCHALLQGIFLTQGSNLWLLHPLHWQVGSSRLAPPGKPILHISYTNCVLSLSSNKYSEIKDLCFREIK